MLLARKQRNSTPQYSQLQFASENPTSYSFSSNKYPELRWIHAALGSSHCNMPLNYTTLEIQSADFSTLIQNKFIFVAIDKQNKRIATNTWMRIPQIKKTVLHMLWLFLVSVEFRFLNVIIAVIVVRHETKRAIILRGTPTGMNNSYSLHTIKQGNFRRFKIKKYLRELH